MKIAIICDTHYGARNDSPIFLDYFLTFFEEQFFPYLREHGITQVLHLGDLMDRRKFVNFFTLSEVKSRFLKPFETGEFKMDCIIGNHDTFYRNTNSLNSVNQLFEKDGITIHENPICLNFDGLDIALVPWINKSNYDSTMDFIKTVSAPILMGHLELTGYQVLRGISHDNGMDAALLSRFESVYSGHFHCRQSGGNVTYLGTPYQITFGDLGEDKGFHVLDTETRNMEFIKNNKKMFHSIVYNDKEQDMTKIDFSQYKNGYIKVIIENKTKPMTFDRFMDGLYTAPVTSVNIIEQESMNLMTEQPVDNSQDTLSIINTEIDGMEEIENKNKLKTLIYDLYMESISVE